MDNIITKIEVGKRNKNRVNIFINEDFAFSCSADLVYYHKLTKGKKIDLELLNAIVREDSYLKGKNEALKILEKAYKSEKEIVEKLQNKGYEVDIIGKILDFLKSYDFINDEKYAEMFIKEKIKDKSKNQIKYLLLRKGINKELIQDKLENIDSSLEREVAYKLAEKKYHRIIKMEKNSYKINKKIGEYLAGKGYNFDIINSVLNTLGIGLKEYDNENSKSIANADCNENHESCFKDINLEKLEEIARKRYRVLIKSEKDSLIIYRKLSQYLLRKGYPWEDIKKTLKGIVNNE